MSKAIGKILTVAAVAVAIVAAIPTGGASLAAGISIIGVSTSTLALIGAGIAAASLVNSLALAGKQAGRNQARQASETSVQIGEVARRAIFGRAATAGSLVDAFNFGGKYGTDWEVQVLALADHRCDALEAFYVNDQLVTFAGDGPVAGYKGQLEVTWLAGTENQTPPSVLVAQGGWSANDRLRGVSAVVVAYKADEPNSKTPVWTGGRPSFLWVLRGLKLYDPRKDSTVAGGSGAHRWSDPATREWSENAELCRYNYDRGVFACDRVDQPTQLLVGRGLSPIEAPPERVFAAANLCDEAVALAGGASEPRYRAGGVVAADEQFGDVTDAFAAAMGGIVIQPEGSVAVEPGQAKSVVATITDADVISGTRRSFSEFRSEADEEWVNTVIPRYVEPTQKWADHSAPIRREEGDVVADGGPREATLSLRLVTSTTQAQRIGEIRRRQGRLWKTGAQTLGPRFAELEEGDWIAWQSDRHLNGGTVTFRIESYGLGRDWRNALHLREMSASVYSFAANAAVAGQAVATQQTPVTDAYYLSPRAAHAIVDQTVAFPVSSTANSISVVAFSATIDTGATIAFPADTRNGLASDTAYAIFWHLALEQYVIVPEGSASPQFASADYVFVRRYRTQLSGGGYTPPSGGGGGDGGSGPGRFTSI